jgi:hypothetical protein
MKWFRLWTDILDDVKMLQLSDYEFRMWTYLMAIASEVDSMSGECQLNVKSMSLRCRTQVNHLSRAIETFQSLGMVTINGDGFIVITNWNKRQYKSDNAYQRVKKFREVTQKRNVSCNDIETAPDTDTDTDKKKYIKKEKYSSDFELFWKEYPSKVAKGDAFKCWSKINGQRPDLSVILSAIQKQKDWRKNANGAFRPEWKHPASWLNKGCWEDEVVAPQAGRKPW